MKPAAETVISVRDAAVRAGVTRQTIRNWIRRYGIGWKRAGRLVVVAERLDALMRGDAQ